MLPSEPSVEQLATRIHGLQRGFTSRSEEREIVRLLTSVRGSTLTRLKCRIDAGSDHRDLLKLVYDDIDDHGLREELLEHIREHSLRLPGQLRSLRVVSDIDDTLYSSLNDSRFGRGTLYPGVLAFHEELGHATSDPDSPVTDLVLLTARPNDGLGLVERITKRQMRSLKFESVIVLGGSLAALRSHQAMAEKKLENFARYQELFPEFDFLFIGDSGQGDAALGEKLLAQFPERVRLVLIHKVTDAPVKGDSIRVFHSYLGAALLLKAEGLLSQAACDRIAQASRDDVAPKSA